MKISSLFIWIFSGTLILVMFGWRFFQKEPGRETIFDRVVSIPTKMVLDIPHLPPLCDEIAGLKKGFVDIKDGKLYYEEEGQGIPIVLLNPGPGGPHHCFHPHFSKLKDVTRIIYYDARGTGKSSIDDTGVTYTIKQAVEDLEKLREHLKIDQWMVLGWSFGGFLAQCYALTHPERVKGLILVASVAGLSKVKMLPSRKKMFLTKAEIEAIDKVSEKRNKSELTRVQWIYNKRLRGDWKRQDLYKPTEEEIIRFSLYGWSPAPGFNWLMGISRDSIDLQGKFDDFEIPTLVMEGKWDLVWNVDKAGFIRKNHPKAQFEYFENSSHVIFSDEPEKFFGILRKFIKESNAKNITAKAGIRLIWPEPPADLERKFIMSQFIKDKEEQKTAFFNVYEQALRENLVDKDIWYAFVQYFISTKNNFEKCLMALQHLEASAKKTEPKLWNDFGYCIFAWQGHMLDLLERRDEAIKHYKKALELNNGKRDKYFPVSIFIDRDWLEDRLKIPFEWGT